MMRVACAAAAFLVFVALPGRAADPESGLTFRGQSVDAMLKDFADPDAKTRAKVIGSLTSQLGPSAHMLVPALTKLLTDSDASVRMDAADCLGRIGPGAADAGPALIEALKDKESQVRENAAKALGRLGPSIKGAVSALAAALKDRSVTLQAIEGLGELGPAAEEAVPALKVFVEDEKGRYRVEAALAIGQIAPKATPLLALVALTRGNDRLWAAHALNQLGSACAPVASELVDNLNFWDHDVGAHAAVTLGKIGAVSDDVVPALVKTATEPWKRKEGVTGSAGEWSAVQRAAVDALGAIGPAAKDAVPKLTTLWDSRDISLRLKAIAAVLRIDAGNKDATAALIGCLEKGASEGALKAIQTIGPAAADAVPTMLQMKMIHGQEGVEALRALVAIGPKAKGAATDLVNQAEGRQRFGGGWPFAIAALQVDPGNKGAAEMLATRLADEKERDRDSIAKRLGKLGPAAKPLVPALVPLVKSKDIEVRWEAAQSLKAIDPEAARKAGVP
jgi:HEAT repeat protein